MLSPFKKLMLNYLDDTGRLKVTKSAAFAKKRFNLCFSPGWQEGGVKTGQ
jgi:hypothetical protein